MNDEMKRQPDSGQRVLIIDDEAVVCLSCERILTSDGHKVDYRCDARDGLEAAIKGNYDIILLDLMMPDLGGLELLDLIRQAGVTSEVIIITGYSDVKSAVEAIKRGASDYVSKPFTPEELRIIVQKVIEHSALIRENARLRRELQSKMDFQGLVGESKAMERVFALIGQVAPTDGTVLITGESGTGKEMVARAIHQLSPRVAKPFVTCDCGALAPTLLESELFGHVQGSFTGAISAKEGLFEVADTGTLFLDEVSNISLEVQAKLLRVLESRKVKRVGDTAERDVRIRLIAATNQDLGILVKERLFRADLYYRLHVVPIQVPPLRDREGDVPLLCMTFLERFRASNRAKAKTFTPQAMRKLEEYPWNGNVRELRNIVERIAILCSSESVDVCDLPEEIRNVHSDALMKPLPATWDEFKELKRQVRDAAVEDIEKRFLMQALEQTGGNVTKAAENIGIQRTNFHALMQKYGIATKSSPSESE